MAVDNRTCFSSIEELRRFHPASLAGFLRRHKEYAARMGVTVPENPTDENMPWKALPGLFMRRLPDTPMMMLTDMALIAEMATASGHDKLVAEIERLKREAPKTLEGLDLTEKAGMTDHDFAMQVCLEKRDLLEKAHARVVLFKKSSFDYYPAYGVEIPPLLIGESEDLSKFEKSLDVWFHGNNRGLGTKVLMFPFSEEIWFLVGHGSKPVRIGCLDESGGRVTFFGRPEEYDAVIFRKDFGELRIRAEAKFHPMYLLKFGELLLGNGDFFSHRDVFTLEGLRSGNPAAITWGVEDGFEGVRLVELGYELPSGRIVIQRSKGCLLHGAEPGEVLVPDNAVRVVRARFGIRFPGARDCRIVRVDAGRCAQYCRDGDSSAVEAWLRKREFMIMPKGHKHEKAA